MATGQFHATEHAVVVSVGSDIDIKWLRYKLVDLNLNQYATGVAQPGLSVGNLKSIMVVVPPLAEQAALVAQIEAIEAQIAEAQRIINNAPAQKQAILKQYL